jgi:two-component system cell cycle sensor histidine kinase/response regulator CckA
MSTQQELVKILLVEDDRDCYLLTQFALEDAVPGRFELDWVARADEAQELIARGEHDLYFVDYRLGETDGVEIIRRARECGVDATMILFTGMDDPRVVARAAEAGASDYFVKGKIDVERLEHALETAVQDDRSKRRSSTRFAPPEISTANTSPTPPA